MYSKTGRTAGLYKPTAESLPVLLQLRSLERQHCKNLRLRVCPVKLEKE